MAKLNLEKYTDKDLNDLVESRWRSSSEVWDVVGKVTSQNTAVYENRSEWLGQIPEKRSRYRVQANRIFPNMESVINSLIANPPGINVLPGKDGIPAQDFARKLENFLRKKYVDLNIKEVMRMGLRNLYFSRLIVVKAFWNPSLGDGGDFDYRAIDPTKVRIGKNARKEQDSEFFIEEIDDNLCALVERFPEKKGELMKKYGFYGEEGEKQMYIQNPDVVYKEAWIQDYVIFKLDNIILGKIKNPYWDWQGILITEEEEAQIEAMDITQRREFLQGIKLQQEERRAQMPVEESGEKKGLLQKAVDTVKGVFSQPEEVVAQEIPAVNYKPYYFNYFKSPRKPYIFATIFNNKNSPIGRTDMITLSVELQRSVDKRKMDIDENCELVNGFLKVDSSVMPKNDAQRIRFETKGIIWGKGVVAGVTREMGTPLPAFVHEDMVDSRNEIDNIMAASSAFRGEREGQETKAGRLALIQQSYLRLNELVQVTDYVYHEIFNWGMQLAKTRYTEYHTTKLNGKEGERGVIELIQDDFDEGTEVTIIAGKTVPVDDEFKFERAQNDYDRGALGLTDYLEFEGYDNAKVLAQNAVKQKINPIMAVGMSPEEAAELAPPAAEEEKKPPSVSIKYEDLPADAQVQLLAQIGIQANPEILIAEKMADRNAEKERNSLKNNLVKQKEVKTT